MTVAFRQPFTKARGSMRTIKVDAECLAMLCKRKMAAAPGNLERPVVDFADAR